MKKTMWGWLLVLAALSPRAAPAQAQASRPIPPDKVRQLKELRTIIRGWARYCPDGTITNAECPFGDQALFAGLLCLSGEARPCEGVRNSQSASGEFFRAPGLVDRERSNGKATFSRDQARGVLAYLIATKDVGAAARWMSFIESNDWEWCKKPKDKTTNGCDPKQLWGTIGAVWDYLDLPRNERMRTPWWYDAYKRLEARHQPNDYPLHLTATSIFLRREIEKRSRRPDKEHKELAALTDIINERAPLNPYFNYLKFGANEAAADVVLRYCPQEPPLMKNGERGADWAWQRSIDNVFDQDNGYKTWDFPGGHECIFMINLLVGPGA